MNVAVVGSSGYIASRLIETLSDADDVGSVLRIGRSGDADARLDLERPEAFDYGRLGGVDFIALTAAVSSPDACASHYTESWAVNVEGTSHFIGRAIGLGCRVLFFSSDAVFGDIPGMIYDEGSETRACTAYGKMKKAVEDEFRGSPMFKAVRLPYVVSAKDKFASYCLECIWNGREAEVFHPIYRNCVAIGDVADAASWLMGHWDEYCPPVLNLAGSELVSRVRIADEINRIFKGRLSYKIRIPDDAFFDNRPRITQMRSLYLGEYRILKDESFTEKIQREFRGCPGARGLPGGGGARPG